MHRSTFIALFSLIFVCATCKKDDAQPNYSTAKVNFIFRFDSTQARLNNIGNPSTIPAGNAAQSPRFNSMSAHYVELAQNQFTALGSGAVLYRAAETGAGGANAIDFSKSKFAGDNQTFLSAPVSSMAAGTYNWLRVSLAYQNYDIKYRFNNIDVSGTIASFIGFNTYVNSFKIKDSTFIVNDDRLQGFWAFETSYMGFGSVSSGQAPPGATTVPNPLQATSPIPAGSCVVTGQFAQPLVVTGNETGDINIVVSLSVNKSFEWTDINNNGVYEPVTGEAVVDMGVRGLIPIRQ